MCKSITLCALFCLLGAAGCVSVKDYEKLLEEQERILNENGGKQVFIDRLKTANEALTNDKFATLSATSSKIENLEKLVQAQKEELEQLRQKYNVVLGQNFELTQNLQTKTQALDSLVAKIEYDRQESLKQLEQVQESRRWVYSKRKRKFK